MEIRLALPHEYDDAGELTAAAYAGDGLIPEGDDYLGELRDARRRAEEAELWVAVEEDRLLGCVTYCPSGSPYLELAGPDDGEFRMLAVAPDARRRGVAEALVRRCLDRARELDRTAMVLCSMDLMTGAHRLYGRLGFERWPERDWSPVKTVQLWAFRLALEPDRSVARGGHSGEEALGVDHDPSHLP